MHAGKHPHARGGRALLVALTLVALAVALALVSTSRGSTTTAHAAKTGPVYVSSGHGYGEVYKAKASTLAHTFFKASLIPCCGMARNITLAGIGRADRKVNLKLALKCWKNNGCNTGTGGKMTVAYVEQFGENVYRQMSRMEFILQALTYPQVGKIIYKSAHSDPNQGLADIRAMVAQHVNLIVTYPDYGDSMLPANQLRFSRSASWTSVMPTPEKPGGMPMLPG